MKYLFTTTLFLYSFFAISNSSSLNSRGNQFNPEIGLNSTFLMKDSQVDSEGDGFSLQGVELQFNADVDAYFRAQAVIGIHPAGHEEHEEGEEEEHAEGYEVHPEEAFIETIAIPSITLKGGVFLSQFGKYNSVHLHALPFIYRGVVQEEMFGHEGFGAAGVSASFLMPLSWFSEFTLEALSPSNEDLFEESAHATVYVGKLKNLWELSNSTTVEWGISGLNYERAAYNDNDTEITSLVGTDLTIKWRPLKNGKSESAMWSTEYISKTREGSVEEENAGITSFFRYQFKQRWFGQFQYEYLGIDRSEDEDYAHATSALIGFIPSEFSGIRLQYDVIKSNEFDEDEKRLSLQLNMSIGAHPAHTY